MNSRLPGMNSILYYFEGFVVYHFSTLEVIFCVFLAEISVDFEMIS